MNGLVERADLGTYWKATTPTPGTGVAQAIQAAFSATAGVLRVRNSFTGKARLYMDYIRLIPTVVPASATRSELVVAIDNVDRFSSGGTTLTPKNVNMDEESGQSGATLNFGALVLAAESAAVRRVARAQARAAIYVAFEELLIVFGKEADYPQTLGGTTALRLVVPVRPAILGSGDDLLLHLWHPGNAVTAASWEVEVAWWVR